MQTREDIEKWEKYRPEVELILVAGGDCGGVDCRMCPFGARNNGHGVTCDPEGLGVKRIWVWFKEKDSVLAEACEKYLKGDITFVDGKLVELVD